MSAWVASNVARLPRVKDGTLGIIRVGTYPDVVCESLWYDAADSKYIGRPFQLASGNDQNFVGSTQTEWGYINSPVAAPGSSWHLHGAIDHAGELYAAGLKLQMQVVGRGKGNGTYSFDLSPFFFEYGVVVGTDNKLSLNNDSATVPFANMQNGANSTMSATTALPGVTTSAFTLSNITSTAGFTGTGTIVILHSSFDRPVRIAYTGTTGTTFTGCTASGASYNLNNLSIPSGALVYQARATVAFPPSGYNPNGLPTFTGTSAGPGDGNVGNGPVWNSGIAAPANSAWSSTGWKDVQFYKSFSSGEVDTTRPYTPTKRLLYGTMYARLNNVPQGTTPTQGVLAAFVLRARWVG